MTNSEVPSGEPTAEQSGSSRRGLYLGVALALVVAIGAGGVIPQLLGYGWFGHRPLLYGQGQLYVLNLTDQPHLISVDHRVAQQVEADGAELLPIVGGVSIVEAINESEGSAQRWEVETRRSHALLNLADDTCFVVAEVSNIFDDEQLQVEIEQVVDGQTGVIPLGSERIIWPRGYPKAVGEQGDDPVYSIEIADCEITEDDEFLRDYLQSRLEARM